MNAEVVRAQVKKYLVIVSSINFLNNTIIRLFLRLKRQYTGKLPAENRQ